MKIGFIGTGNMGGALARAVCRAVSPQDVLACDYAPEKAEQLCAELGCIKADAKTAAAEADYLFLGVKPVGVVPLLTQLQPILQERSVHCTLISMAAGVSVETVEQAAGGACPVIRIMPNTPVSVGEGMVLYVCSRLVSASQKQTFLQLLSQAGRLSEIPENLIDAGCAVSGCGPAFADLFMEALADGGVACGLPRQQAQTLAAQMLLGSAKLALASGKQPGVLKDEVCSPGGTTIQGVRALEKAGFRSAAMEAVIAAYEKTRQS